MLDVAEPLAFLLLPLPYLVWRFVPPHTETVESLRVPYFARIAELTGASPERGAIVRRRNLLRLGVLLVIWVAIVAALARPQLRGEPVTVTRSARDLLLAVDLSGSMETRDLKNEAGEATTRLSVVKEVVGEFAQKRKGDRLGLLVFGAAPYMQVPFTLDTSLVTRLLEETRVHMAGDSTTLGDAMGLSIRTFERSSAKNRVLVLLTDGNDTGSQVPPETAALIAAKKGITIHVVGVGDPTLAGEDRLNETVLARIAQLTGGAYFHADNRAELEKIYAELDRLEKIEFESRTFTPRREIYHYPLGVAAVLLSLFLLSLVLLGLRRSKRRHPPEVESAPGGVA